jgi:hypothetical protein|tara:strand:+ start:931 stop:1086 length:156 start_codon:yes stop_codon:yes gene_type:complete
MEKEDKKQDNQWLSSKDFNKIAKNRGIEYAIKLHRLQDKLKKLDNLVKYYE